MQPGYGDEDASGCGVSGIHYSNIPNPSNTPHYMQQHVQHLSYFHPNIPVPHQVHLFQDLNEEEESSIKEPFWRPLDLDYKKEKDNYKIFSELEAICKPTSANAIAQSDEKKKKKMMKKKMKKRKKEQRLNSIVLFFESLTKKLIEHQEELHRKFLDAMERKDQERMRKQEAWMKQEAANAMARAEEQAISSARVATIVSFLERITKDASVQFPHQNNKDNDRTIREEEKEKTLISSDIRLYSNRWPKAEVEALIGVRSKLEFMFKEAGVKGHVWEEVSSRMRSMGFNRSAKRCKEKWENINKYFRKKKESGKARPVNSKTCPYFHHLDQLYSKSSMSASTSSELLDAIVVPNEQMSFKFSEDEDEEYDDDEEEEEEKGEYI